MRENATAAASRWARLDRIRAEYPSFVPFLRDVMEELGFSTTELQEDIAGFLEFGPHYLMIQAQRGQAKTTITAAFAVWSLIHDPSGRILILSAGGTQANEISTLIVRIIMNMPELECLRPDRIAGDRTSVEAFDVHHSLKGIDKSPSVACVGITGNLQGKRASILIADDVESAKNSLTEHQRQQLLNLTRDFSSICSTGRIIYLGTPQSINSIYNTLPGRGFTVRVWTGRYPTPEQRKHYGDALAPWITRRLDAQPALGTGGGYLGDQGQPTDPALMDEETLCKKARDQGDSYFQLQHMLDTKLADADRYPLRTEKLLVVRVIGDVFPLAVTPRLEPDPSCKYELFGTTYHFGAPQTTSEDRTRLQGVLMYVDPAGGGKNGDETAYAIVGFLNGNVWVLEVSGVPGGFSDESYKQLARRAAHWKVNRIQVEKNFGHGAFLHSWLPTLRAEYPSSKQGGGCAIEDIQETGQKELRIIDTIEPILGRGAVLINEDIIREEEASLARYPSAQRSTYSLFHQLTKVTRDKGALLHDDRLDALAGAIRYWIVQLGIDQDRILAEKRAAEMRAWQKNPLGYTHGIHGRPSHHGSLINQRTRR